MHVGYLDTWAFKNYNNIKQKKREHRSTTQWLVTNNHAITSVYVDQLRGDFTVFQALEF
jgi:hypothetical protein